MAKRLTFQQLKGLLENPTAPIENLADYVQFDPDSPIPKLRFKTRVMQEQAKHEDYDVDHAIQKYSRKIEEEKRVQGTKLQSTKLKSVVAEGDSWFKLPSFFGIPAIATRIKKNGRFDMKNIAHWGDTLSDILKSKEYIEVMREKTPNFFIFSAGGNDLRAGIAEQDKDKRYIHEYGEERKYDDYLTEAGKAGIKAIGIGYQKILNEVTKEYPDLKVFCHGYDYPRPCKVDDEVGDELENGDVCEVEFIGQYLRFLGIPYDKMDAILKPIVNLLNKTIQDITNSYESVEFINLRGVVSKPEFDWIDDIHPGDEGFKALASKFEEAMSPSKPVV